MRLAVGGKDGGEAAAGGRRSLERHGHDGHRQAVVAHGQPRVGVVALDGERRGGGDEKRQGLLLAHALASAEHDVEDLFEPGRELGRAERILHVLAEGGEDVGKVAHEAGRLLVVGRVVGGAPVQTDLVEGVEKPRGGEPVVVGGRPALARRGVDHVGRAAVGQQRMASCVHREAPAGAAAAERVALAGRRQRALDEVGRKPHDAASPRRPGHRPRPGCGGRRPYRSARRPVRARSGCARGPAPARRADRICSVVCTRSHLDRELVAGGVAADRRLLVIGRVLLCQQQVVVAGLARRRAGPAEDAPEDKIADRSRKRGRCSPRCRTSRRRGRAA